MLLPFLGAAWLLTFAAMAAWSAPWWMAGAWFGAVAPVVTWRAGPRAALVCLVAGGMAAAAGALFVASERDHTTAIPGGFGLEVVIEGVVASEPDPGLRSVRLRIDADRASVRGVEQRVDVAVIATLHQYTRLLPGDRVRLRGEVEEPPSDLDGFDYRAYLLSRGVIGTMLFPAVEVLERGQEADHRRLSVRLRLALERSLQRSLPEPEASLAAGIAVGRDDSMPPELVEDFRRSGLAHLTAVSGGNVAVLAAIVFAVAVPLLGRSWAIAPAILVVAGYVAAAGFAPSVVRASIMAWMVLVGFWLGRPQSGLAGLAAAAIVMTALDPAIARDPGFQLSLAATAGLLVFAPWIQAGVDLGLVRSRLGGFAGTLPVQVFSLSAAATIATLPIVAHTFGTVSIVGLLANVCAEPLFVVAFPLSLFAAAAGLAWSDAGWALGLVAYYPLAAINALASGAAGVPGASVSPGRIGTEAVLAWYAGYAAAGWFFYRRFAPRLAPRGPSRAQRLARRASYAGLAGLLTAWAGIAAISPIGGPGELEVHILDVGQGDAALIRTPAGRNVLVDGGPSGLGLARALGGALPHWERRLDLVILTHAHEDHVAGLVEAFRRFEVGSVATNGLPADSLSYRLFREAADHLAVLEAGSTVTIDGVRFVVLWPEDLATGDDPNGSSLVLRVEYREAALLLAADVGAPEQVALSRSAAVGAQVLKVPHHGAADISTAFLAAAGAGVAVISAGEGNPFGHPAPATLERLADSRVYRTDIDGTIVLRTDGTTGWRVESER